MGAGKAESPPAGSGARGHGDSRSVARVTRLHPQPREQDHGGSISRWDTGPEICAPGLAALSLRPWTRPRVSVPGWPWAHTCPVAPSLWPTATASAGHGSEVDLPAAEPAPGGTHSLCGQTPPRFGVVPPRKSRLMKSKGLGAASVWIQHSGRGWRHTGYGQDGHGPRRTTRQPSPLAPR